MEKQQVREKVGESRFTLFFQWIVALGGRKVGSLKRRVRSHLARWDEKLHAVVARSTCRSQNTQSTRFASLLEAQMSKKCTSLWREARFQVKSVKKRRVRTTFWRSDVEKVYAVLARSTFGSQKGKKLRGGWAFFDVQMSKKSLTNSTNLTNLTNTTNLANLTN